MTGLDWVGRLTRLNKQKTEIDYRVFFALGVCFMGLGVVFTSAISLAFVSFLGCGVIFMIIGLANRTNGRNPRRKLEYPLTTRSRSLQINGEIIQ